MTAVQHPEDTRSFAVDPHLFLAAAMIAPSVTLAEPTVTQLVGQLSAIVLATLVLAGQRPFGRLAMVVGGTILAVTFCLNISVAVRDSFHPSMAPGLIVLSTTGLLCVLGGAAVLASRLLRGGRFGWLPGVGALGAIAAVGLSIHPVIDVIVFLRDGAAGLLHGHDPYAMTFHSPFSKAQNARFYSPSVLDGRTVTAGFPYPPVVLVMACVGWLLGDPRIAAALALVVTLAVLGRLSGAAAQLLVLVPGTVFILTYGWVEPVCIMLLALTVVACIRGDRWAPVWLGLLLVSKQYFVVVLPLVWLLMPAGAERGRAARWLGTALGTAAATLLPFAAWDFHGLWRSLVEFQFLQPYRPDSSSLLVWVVNRTGWPSPAVYGVLPIAAGLVVACLLAWRAPRHPAAFAAATAVTLTVVITLSKQAFANYWFLVAAALMVAALTWHRSQPKTADAGDTLQGMSPASGTS